MLIGRLFFQGGTGFSRWSGISLVSTVKSFPLKRWFLLSIYPAPEKLHNSVDRSQRIRLTRLYMAMATYSIIIVAACLVSNLGTLQMPAWACITFVAYAVVTNTLFFIVIRNGFNLSCSDPSLTQAQLILSSVWGFFPFYFLYDDRVLCQLCYLPAFSFGMLRLGFRQYLVVVLAMMLTYCSAVGLDYYLQRPNFSLKYEVFQSVVFFVILLWFSCFGGFVSGLRNRLRKQIKELDIARSIIEKYAKTDDLTNLFNRRYAREVLAEQIARSTRDVHIFSVVMIDIDHFKAINDGYGHEMGDRVLKEFSFMCGALLRGADTLAKPDATLARYGGEEFIVVLPSTSVNQAKICMDRLRLGMASLAESHLSDPVTFSAGVAEYRAGEQIGPLLIRTDKALYRAKSEGRNRICMAE